MCLLPKRRVARPSYDPRKKALLVGINYFGTDKALRGCIRDVETMAQLLVSVYLYDPRNILILRDDSRNPQLQPTKSNILRGIQWLVSNLVHGSHLVFHFSGHGVRLKGGGAHEANGMKKCLLPCDYRTAGAIKDERLNSALVNPIPSGVQLFCLIDACHSATVLDLPYNCRRSMGRLTWKDTYERLPSVWKGSNGGLVVQISAAEDGQKAVDATQPSGRASGAATYSLMVALTQHHCKITWARLLIEMHKALDSKDRFGLRPTTGKLGEAMNKIAYAAGYRGQTPVMSSNTMFDLDTAFVL